MWREPVTFGGGITMEKVLSPEAMLGLK